MATTSQFSQKRFSGVFSLLLTPFRADRSIDWEAYDRYVDWQLRHAPAGLFAVCGSSEMKWLTLEERLALARRAVQRAGDIPIVATANLELDRSTHLDEVKRMVDTGVSGIVLVPPDGLGREPERLHDHLAQLAGAAACSVFLYEWPQVSPHHIPSQLYADLVHEHGLVGIKDTTCTLDGIRAKIDAAPDSIVYQANTPYLLKAVDMGARGVMAITSAAAADLVVACWQASTTRRDEAVEFHRQLVFLDAVLRFGYPTTAKYLAHLRGARMELHCRWPGELSIEAKQAMEIWLESVQANSFTGDHIGEYL